MKYLAIATILTLATLVACETEDAVEETSIIVDEGSTIVINSSTEEQADEQADENLNALDRIVRNLTGGRGCYVGETIHLKATVAERTLHHPRFWEVESLVLETNNDKLWIRINMSPVNDFVKCPSKYYKEGETYVFPIFIRIIETDFHKGWRIGEPPPLRVYSTIVVTEELKEELRKVDCEDEEG